MMNGQKVIKVFCHEEESKAAFDALNDALFEESEKANRYANTLGPILNNIGNVLYVLVAVTGGALLLAGAPNLSVSGLALSISIVVPFLNMTNSSRATSTRCLIRSMRWSWAWRAPSASLTSWTKPRRRTRAM